MIVCYARGDGLGHLTRLRAYLHTIGHHEPVTILTTSPFATDPRVTGLHTVLTPPPGPATSPSSADPRTVLTPPPGPVAVRPAPARSGAHSIAAQAAATGPASARLPDAAAITSAESLWLRAWVGEVLREVGASEFVVDAFPAGLGGELDASVVPPGTRVTHLARLLRWPEYAGCLPDRPLRFDRTWLVEPVGHEDYLASVSERVAPLRLAEPPADDGVGPGGWLVVHSGPAEETLELVAYARETARLEDARPALTVVSPYRPEALEPDVGHLDVYPAWPLFDRAERIITAAGCNAVRQAAPWRERHRMVPFPRRYDDQFARAARHAR